jgi:hypothetical protein
MRTIGWGVDRDVGTPRRRGPGRWQRLGILVVCLDLVVVGMVVGQLGVGTGRGVAFAAGGSDVDPIGYLGATLDTTGCQSAALNVGEGLFVICEDWSAITSPGGTTWVVSLYAAGNPVIGEYNGALPQALYWHETCTAPPRLSTCTPRSATGPWSCSSTTPTGSSGSTPAWSADRAADGFDRPLRATYPTQIVSYRAGESRGE